MQLTHRVDELTNRVAKSLDEFVNKTKVAEARERLEDTEDARLVGLAEAAFAANWALLDGVST